MRKAKTEGWRRAIEEGTKWTASEAGEALRECDESGESVAVFARKHGLTPNRLYWWRQQLKEQAPRALIPVSVRALQSVPGRNANAVVIDGELRIEVVDTTGVGVEWVAALLERMRERRR